MPEFNIVAHAVRTPTSCFFCGDFEGPFIDTYTEAFSHGNVLICAPQYTESGEQKRPGCLGQMAGLAGMISMGEVGEIEDQLLVERENNQRLRNEVKAAIVDLDLLVNEKLTLAIGEA